jgi:hypothetical protein
MNLRNTFQRFMVKMFKVCPCCGRSYRRKEDFLTETNYIGDMGALKLYNCSCGSTMAVKTVS